MDHWHEILNRYGKQSCLVISYEDKKVMCISLYAKDTTSYESFNGVIKSEAEAHGGQNKNPSDHAAIHELFGKAFDVPPATTQTDSTHFHWVFGGLDFDNGFYVFVMKLKETGMINTATSKIMYGLLQ